LSGLADLAGLVPDDVSQAEIPFGDWTPNAPALNNPGAYEALNVIPAEGGYTPFQQLEVSPTNVLTDAVSSAYAVLSEDDVVQLYASTVNEIATSVGGGFITILAAPVSAKYSWKFIRVNEQMVALHPGHVPVRHTVGTVGAVVNVGGTPPTAKCGAQVGDFLMLGNLVIDPDDGGGKFPARVRWSGFNNIDSPWVTDVATQADFQDLPADGGPVMAISGREKGVIFQARTISVATYRGLPDVFDFVQVEDKRGTIARDSIVDSGQGKFFIAEDGFFYWNGVNTQPIGNGIVNRYFFNRLQYNERSRICGAVDTVNGCIMWAFPTSSSGSLDEIIIYSQRENRWSHSIQTLEYLFSSASSNTSIDSLTDPLESYTVSFDDDVFNTGGRGRIAAFNTQHTYGLFTGLPMQAIVDTGEFTGPDGRRVFVNGVRPIIDLSSPAAQMQLAMRDQMIGQAVLFSDPVDQELDGNCPIIGDARYVRFRLNVPADISWTHAMGVDVNRKATGLF
jgi:hypothetical protein